jgi:hypothetical protein
VREGVSRSVLRGKRVRGRWEVTTVLQTKKTKREIAGRRVVFVKENPSVRERRFCPLGGKTFSRQLEIRPFSPGFNSPDPQNLYSISVIFSFKGISI